jgi:hypothetical protein
LAASPGLVVEQKQQGIRRINQRLSTVRLDSILLCMELLLAFSGLMHCSNRQSAASSESGI